MQDPQEVYEHTDRMTDLDIEDAKAKEQMARWPDFTFAPHRI